MLIKKESRIYSYIDEYGDERLYSINEYLPEDEYLEELMFSYNERMYGSVKAANKVAKRAWEKSIGGRSMLRDRVGREVGAVSGTWGLPTRNINRSINIKSIEAGGASASKLAQGSGKIGTGAKRSGKRFYDHESLGGNISANKQIMKYFK